MRRVALSVQVCKLSLLLLFQLVYFPKLHPHVCYLLLLSPPLLVADLADGLAGCARLVGEVEHGREGEEGEAEDGEDDGSMRPALTHYEMWGLSFAFTPNTLLCPEEGSVL